MAGLCTPLPTLRRCPRGQLRTARGRCGLLFLHRSGLPPPTPCRSPGASPQNGLEPHLHRCPAFAELKLARWLFRLSPGACKPGLLVARQAWGTVVMQDFSETGPGKIVLYCAAAGPWEEPATG